MGLRTSTSGDHALVRGEKLSSAVWVLALCLVGADVDVGCAKDLGPSHGHAEQVGVAEGDVSRGQVGGGLVFGYGLGRIEQARAADLAHVLEVHHEAGRYLKVLCEGGKGRKFAAFGALAIVRVEKGQWTAAGGNGRGDAGVEPTAD